MGRVHFYLGPLELDVCVRERVELGRIPEPSKGSPQFADGPSGVAQAEITLPETRQSNIVGLAAFMGIASDTLSAIS